MSTDVNPPRNLRVPQSLAKTPQDKAFLESELTILFQMWLRTGGQKDQVAENQDNIDNLCQQMADLE